MTRFYCSTNGKIKKEPEKPELDINVAKTEISAFFCGRLCSKSRILRSSMKICVPRNTAGPVNNILISS